MLECIDGPSSSVLLLLMFCVIWLCRCMSLNLDQAMGLLLANRMRWKQQCAISEPRPSDILQVSLCTLCLCHCHYQGTRTLAPGPRRKKRDSWRAKPLQQSPARTSQTPVDPRFVTHEHNFKPLRYGLVYYVAKVDSSFLCVIPALVPYSLRHKVQAKPSSVWTQLLLLSWCLQISLFTLHFSSSSNASC